MTVRLKWPARCAQSWHSAKRLAALWALCLPFVCYAPDNHTAPANDPTTAVLHKYMSDMDARGDGYRPGNNEYSPEHVEQFEHGLQNKVRDMDTPPPEPPPAAAVSDGAVVLIATLVSGAFLAFMVLLPKFAPFLNKCFGRWLRGSKDAETLSQEVLVQEKQFSEFLTRFQNGPATLAAETPSDAPATVASTAEHFFQVANQPLQSIRTFFAQLSGAEDEESRHKILTDMSAETRRLRLFCERPEFKPVWQLTTAFEQLLRQLADKSCELTPSLLRTSASAIICLDGLCKPGVVWKDASEPPVRFLAVDDDPICRHALGSTLKKTFHPPDLAENGETGLAEAMENVYDAIFLDVEMPGMDGFELCSRIHEMTINENTPVVFVTSHGDFDSRAKSTEVGGYELIAKPFLPLELIVKAQTLVLRRRLLSPAPDALPKETTDEQAPAPPAKTRKERRRERAAQELAEAARGVTPATPAEPNAVKAPPTIESVPVVGSETHNGHEANTDAQNGHAGSELNDTRQVTPATPANDSAATAPPATESIPASELAASNGHEPAEVAQNKDAGLQLQNTDTPKPSAPTLSSDAEKVPPKSDSATAAETEARDGHEAAPAPQREGVDSPIKKTSEPTPLRRSGRFDSFVAPTFANGLQAEGLRFQLLRAQLQALVSVEDFEARHEALGEFFVGLQPMVAEAEREGLHSALSVGFALENLVRKLLQHPNYTTVSALSTAAAGLGLFEELTFSKAQNRGNFSLNILVVDDDPISRRALSNALQLMFGRPDLAEGGATAVARAKEKQYDVIFLDIVMPDMDGLAACKKIRESATNKSTPILFVTSDNSAEAQDRALRSGGNGFIPKPVLPAEIALAATTFGLSGRLRQKDTAHPTEADNSKKKTQKIPVAHSY